MTSLENIVQPAPEGPLPNETNPDASVSSTSASLSLRSTAKLTGLPAVEHINKSASAALKSPSLSSEQASTLERALNDARIILSRESEGTLPWLQAEGAVLNNLGCLLRRINRLSESVQYLQHAVYLEQKANGKPSVPTLLNLSAACNALGDTQKACDAALSCMNQYASLPSSLRAITLHNLAMCDYHVNQPQVRERVTLLLERAYTEALNGFGSDHVTTETIYRHLSALTGESSTRNADLAARAMRPLALAASAPSLTRTIDDDDEQNHTSLQAYAKLQQQLQKQQQQQQHQQGGDIVTSQYSIDHDDQQQQSGDNNSGINVMDGAKFSSANDTSGGKAGLSEKEARLLQQRIQEDAEASRAAAAAEEEKKAREELERARQLASEAEARRIQKQKELEIQREKDRKHALRTQYKSGMDEYAGPKKFMRFANFATTTTTASTGGTSSAGGGQVRSSSSRLSSAGSTTRTASTTATATPKMNNKVVASQQQQQQQDDTQQQLDPEQAIFDVDPEAPPAPLSFSHVRDQFRAISERERNSRQATFLNDSNNEDLDVSDTESQRSGSHQQRHGETMTMHTLRKHQREATSGSNPRYRLSPRRRNNNNTTDGANKDDQEENEDGQNRKKSATHSIFRETARKRREQFLRELAEDQEYEKETAARRAKERLERDREERFALLRMKVEHRAASLIQRRWRRYQTESLTQLALTSKAMRQNEDMRRARRVVRFARKWLQKAQGRILLCRLRLRYEKDFVYVAVRRVQCAWRCFAARKRTNNIRNEKKEFNQKLMDYERRVLAATQLQMWYRTTTCQNNFEKARHDIKAIAATKIQRWIRKALKRERAAAAEAHRRYRERVGATKIQAAWRGWQGRVFASMERIKIKMNRIKLRDTRATEKLQRIGRAFIWRKRLATLRAEELFALGVENTKISTSAIRTIREREEEKRLQQQEQDEALLRLQQEQERKMKFRPRPPTPSRERVIAAEKFLDEARSFALDSMQARIEEERIRRFDRPTVSQYDKMWAVEQLARTRDFSNHRRNACAIVIQRWWRLFRRPVLENHRSLYEAKSAARKIAYFEDKFKRDRLREQNDLAKPIRDLKQSLQQEIDEELRSAAAEVDQQNQQQKQKQQEQEQESAEEIAHEIETTGGAANNVFQEWYTKPRSETEKFVQEKKLKAARMKVKAEEKEQEDLIYRSTRVSTSM